MEYRVFKANGAKCIRKFDSLDEAKKWCWTRNAGNEYRIEWKYEGEETPRRIYV